MQQDTIDDVAVTGVQVVEFRLEQVPLCIEYVDLGAGADLETGLGGLQCTAGGDDGGPTRLHIADTGDDAAKGVLDRVQDLTPYLVEPVLRRLEIMTRLARAGGHGTALIQGKAHGEGDESGIAVGTELRFASGQVVPRLQIESGQTTGALDLDLFLCGPGGLPGRDHGVVVLERGIGPNIHIVGLRLRQRQPCTESRQGDLHRTDDTPQGLPLIVEIVLGGDQVGPGAVISGSGLVDIGDGDQAHVETLPGLLELALVGALQRFHDPDRIRGAQHIEIGRGRADHQIDPGVSVLRLRLGDGMVGLFEAYPIRSIIDGLGDRGRQAP